MTTRRSWKRYEQEIAESLKTKRTPLSGEMSRHTKSDTLHEELYVEAKKRDGEFFYKKIRDEWGDVIENSEEEGKIPLMVLSKKYENLDDARVVLRFSDFLDLIEGVIVFG